MTQKYHSNGDGTQPTTVSSSSTAGPSHVYILDQTSCWIPALQLKTHDGKAIVQVPKFTSEQDILSTNYSASSLSSSSNKNNGKKIKVEFENDSRTIDLSHYPNQVLPLQNVDSHSGRLQDYPDMVELPYLHEAAILYNLKLRHVVQLQPYTRTGDIVIAVNPYQWIKGLYSHVKRVNYSNALVWESHQKERDPRMRLTPHVYEVSALSYRGLAFEGQNQSILVSGESGAGKTETVKICLNHIASVQLGPVSERESRRLDQSAHGSAVEASGYTDDPVVQRVVESNPLLEAFGNAKTRRNDNSSRFGKYLQLQFDNIHQGFSATSGYHARCALVGSQCQVYLLEKNRVVSQAPDERNFHIFYQLLTSPDADKTRFWRQLRGKTTAHFKYVTYTDPTTLIEGKTDAQHFQHTLHSLALVGITGETLDHLMHSICMVLQLGNLGLAPGEENAAGAPTAIITTQDELTELAQLMGVSKETLTLAVTERTFSISGGAEAQETHKLPLSAEQSKDACDALAKEIYLRTFLWLVHSINQATRASDEGMPEGTSHGIIGLLDIFGFEVFDVNRFEQLCINYANEKLQQKFTEDIFRSVQEEYQLEGIPLADIWYDDNTDVLDLIEGPTGLLALLNEECVRPKGNEKSFVQKALQINAKSPSLILHRTDQLSFGIHHYAGCVMYDADMFLTRNNDALPVDLKVCAEACGNPIVSRPRDEAIANVDSNRGGPVARSQNSVAATTVWTKYKQQLHALMADLRKTRSRYIRCIKPNSFKQPVLFEHRSVVEQLRCAGVVSGITISRSVFPNRLDNSIVLARYAHLYGKDATIEKKLNGVQTDGSMTPAEERVAKCKALMTHALASQASVDDKGRVIQAFVVGNTRTYFRAGALEWLESTRMRGLDFQASTIQKAARGFLVRSTFRKERERMIAVEEEIKRKLQEEEDEHARNLEESKARRAKIEEEERLLMAEIERLKQAKKDDDNETRQLLSHMEDEKFALEDEIRELENKTDADARRLIMEPKRILAQQRKIMEEQQKLVDFLQKENKKARKEQEKTKEKLAMIQFNLEKLYESTSNLEFAMEEEAEQFNRISHLNEDIKVVLSREKAINRDLSRQVMVAQENYMEEAQARIELQKTLAKMLEYIQNGKMKDKRIIEESVVIALNCQNSAKAEIAVLENEDAKRPHIAMADSVASLSFNDL